MKDHPYYNEVKAIVESIELHKLNIEGVSYDGEEWEECHSNEDVIEAILATDESFVRVRMDPIDYPELCGSQYSNILIVLGNEPGVVIADWTNSYSDISTLIDLISDDVYQQLN
jgi:hypothetical protein